MVGKTSAYMARPCSADLFSECFPGAQLEIHEMEGEYISDALTKKNIQQIMDGYKGSEEVDSYGRIVWKPPDKFYGMMLDAQTGKGKNYWVLHTLRGYAAEKGKKIIYLCNRTALNKQQIMEAEKAVNPAKRPKAAADVSEYETGSLTIMTYHRFYEKLKKHGGQFFKRFSFCVADEVHFFCSDALFNKDTEKILYAIPKVFSKCFRIYMTATPELVYDPIYAAEWEIMEGAYAPDNCEAYIVPETGHITREKLPKMPLYRFRPDFSAYQDVYVFSETEKLLDEIRNSETDKWVVFVTSKSKGKEMRDALMDDNIDTVYIDRDSRSSTDIEIRQQWERIQSTGNLGDSRVLITTSVLDNGFSIHDKEVANIVLFTEDKTEFLQELGRIRLEQGQKLTVYFSCMTQNGRLHFNNRMQILNVFAQYYGNKAIPEYPYPDAEIAGNPLAVLQQKLETDNKIGFVGAKAVKLSDEREVLEPYINNLARCVARDMLKEAEEFAMLMHENEKLAPILYKARWFCNDPDKLGFDNLHVKKLELPRGERTRNEVMDFFQPYLGRVMAEPKKDEETEETKLFQKFSDNFQKIYVKMFPRDRSVNKGVNRQPWKNKAISSHLENIHKECPELPHYYLERGEKTGEYILKLE